MSRVVLVSFAALLLAALIVPASASAAPYARAAAVPERWDKLSQDISDAWPAEQDGNGRYRDYTDAFYSSEYDYTRYGDAMLGYALIQSGIRDSKPELIASGLRGIGWVIKRPKNFHKRGSVFEYMAMASAYNLAKAELGDDADFKALKSGWESWLRTLRPISTIYRRPKTSRYSNHYLIEAIAVLELLRSGLSSSRPGAILGGKRGEIRALTLRLLNSDIPKMDEADAVRVRGQRTFVFSDPPDQPLAYHGFSAGFYARGLDLLGKEASPKALRTLRDVVNASVELTAPDGDNSYFGRGQEDVWSLSATALGAEAAAKLPGSGASRDANFHAVTERVLGRMETSYGNGPDGLWVTPAFRESVQGGVKGTDASTGAPSFAGVALVTLNWALEDMAGDGARPLGRLGADGNGTVQLSLRRARFAVVRRGSLWYAVRRTGSTRAAKDMRNDFGLVALKTREGDEWKDVLRIRPRTASRADSAGPLLMASGGPFFPEGRTISTTSGGVVTIGGGFRTAGGRIVRRGGRFVFRPVGCGVQLTWKTNRGDRFEYSVFFASRPEVDGRTISDASQKVTLSDDAAVSVESGYASGTDGSLFRARMRFAASSGKPLSVTVCAP